MRNTCIIVAAALLLAGVIGYMVLAPGVHVTVRNMGQDVVRDVTINITGRVYSLGDLAPAGSRTVKVSPTSESHIEVEFTDAHGKPVHVDAGGYFEPGYRGRIDFEMKDGKVVTVNDEARISAY